MKNALLTIISILFFAQVRAEIIVTGKLSDDLNMSGQISKVIHTENKEVIKLANEYVEIDNCTSGQFTLVEVEPGIYELKNVLTCDEWVDAPSRVVACPENFLPVCGELAPDKFGGKSLSQLVTFSNGCELYKAKAAFVNKGYCKY